MNKKIFMAALVCGLVAASVQANHQRGIRATVDSLDAMTLAADVYVTVYTTHETNADTEFQSLQWGEGETSTEGTASLTLAFAGTQPSAPGYRTFRGAFSHTYTAGPGPYTLRVVSDSAGTYLTEISEEGGPATGNPFTAFGEPAATPQQAVGYFTNTLEIDFSQVPFVPGLALWLLAGVMAAGGALLLWRR